VQYSSGDDRLSYIAHGRPASVAMIFVASQRMPTRTREGHSLGPSSEIATSGPSQISGLAENKKTHALCKCHCGHFQPQHVEKLGAPLGN
jgi:hypothetical protein